MSALSAAAQDEDGDIIKALQARIADLEAQLYAVGAGGVGNMEQPQCVDWPEVDRLLKTVKYLIGIAERGSGRKMRNDDETVEQFVLSYVRSLEQPQGEQEPVAWIENIGGGVSYNPYHEAARKLPDGVRFDLYTRPQPRQPLTEADFYNIASNYFAAEWAQKLAVMMLKDHGIGGEA